MAANLQFALNGNSSIPPTEWPKLELQLNWDSSDGVTSSLSTSQFTFEGDAAHRINQWNSGGTSGSYGILEGMPFEIIAGTNITALKGCIDTSAAQSVYRCDRVVVPVRDNRIEDYLADRKDGFTFSYLASLPASDPAKISNSDYLLVPYAISDIPDYHQALSTSISLFLIIKEIAEFIRKTGDIAAEVAVPTTTIQAAAKLILQAVYLITVIIALISLIQTLIDSIIQSKKYKKWMYVRTHFEKACAHLHLSFSSTIVGVASSPFYNAAIMPRKIVQPNGNIFKRAADESTTSDSYGHYDGTFGMFIQEMEDIFNAKAVLRGSTLYFERLDYWDNQAAFILPNLDLNGINNGEYRYNASELVSNYFIIWQLDNQELNTYDDYEGTSCQMQARPIVINDEKNVLFQGLREKRLAFSLAKRKENLTKVEKIVDTIINILTFFTGLSPIPQRIGWLLLSNDFTGVQKFAVLDSNNEIHPLNKTYTSATYLMNNYHTSSLPLNDQWLIYEGWEIPFCCEDYVTLLNNNVIKTYDGRLGKMLNLRWQVGSDVATIDFKVRPTGGRYTNNISQTLITDLQ